MSLSLKASYQNKRIINTELPSRNFPSEWNWCRYIFASKNPCCDFMVNCVQLVSVTHILSHLLSFLCIHVTLVGGGGQACPSMIISVCTLKLLNQQAEQ